jgi:hypothetical protein
MRHITDEMKECINKISLDENDNTIEKLYDLCRDIFFGKELTKDQILYIYFIEGHKKWNIILLINLCKTVEKKTGTFVYKKLNNAERCLKQDV